MLLGRICCPIFRSILHFPGSGGRTIYTYGVTKEGPVDFLQSTPIAKRTEHVPR